jgi:hypothetical protein
MADNPGHVILSKKEQNVSSHDTNAAVVAETVE